MESSSATTQLQFDEKTETYFKYRKELENIEKQHAVALQQIQSAVKPTDIVAAKSAEADQLVSHGLRTNADQVFAKFKEVQELLEQSPQSITPEVNQTLNDSLDKFTGETKEARTSFEKMMAEATETFLGCNEDEVSDDDEDEDEDEDKEDGPETELDQYRNSCLETINYAWRMFKEEVRDDYDVPTSASRFVQEMDAAREEFHENSKAILNDIDGAIDESAKDEFERTTDQAVEEYLWLVSSAREYFCLKLDEIVQGEKGEEKGHEDNLERQEVEEEEQEQDEDQEESEPAKSIREFKKTLDEVKAELADAVKLLKEIKDDLKKQQEEDGATNDEDLELLE